MLYGTLFHPEWMHQCNLCPFVRRMLLGVFLSLIIYPLFAVMVIGGILAPWVQLATSLYFGDFSYFWVRDYFFTIGLFVYGFFIAAFLMFLVNSDQSPVRRYFVERYVRIHTKRQQPSVLYQYYRAIKDKVCPQIEIVDND